MTITDTGNLIPPNRALHMAGVAKKAYEIAKTIGWDEDDCRKAFTTGRLHDIGYAFIPAGTQEDENDTDHGIVAERLLSSYGMEEDITDAIARHSFCNTVSEDDKIDLPIIIMLADWMVDGYGNMTTIEERLTDIENRHGKHQRDILEEEANGLFALARKYGLT